MQYNLQDNSQMIQLVKFIASQLYNEDVENRIKSLQHKIEEETNDRISLSHFATQLESRIVNLEESFKNDKKM